MMMQKKEIKTKKICRFTQAKIKYIDYKDPDFLAQFLNEQGKILPRRITGNSLKPLSTMGHCRPSLSRFSSIDVT